VLVSDSAGSLAVPLIADAAKAIEPRREWSPWTDDFNNIMQVLK
jgi:hypothetical protein